MTITETLTRKVCELPLNRQQEALDFVEFLEKKKEHLGLRRDPEGLLADQPSRLSLEESINARRESWCSFPREMPR